MVISDYMDSNSNNNNNTFCTAIGMSVLIIYVLGFFLKNWICNTSYNN